MSEALPRGVWFETERQRFRVRMYRRSQVIWLTYHLTLEEALDAHAQACEFQKSWRPASPVVRQVYHPQTVLDLFR
jgi:hypothetical protein